MSCSQLDKGASSASLMANLDQSVSVAVAVPAHVEARPTAPLLFLQNLSHECRTRAASQGLL